MKRSGLIEVILAVIAITTFAMRWFWREAMDVITPLFAPLYFLLLYGLVFFVLAFSIVYFMMNKQEKPVRRYVALAIAASCITTQLLFPFDKLSLKHDFYSNKEAREEVVQMVKSNFELYDEYEHIELTREFARLSKGGGEVTLEKTGTSFKIIFYTYRGILMGFSGFVYVYNTSLEDGDFYCNFINKVQYDNRWYWINGTYKE
ncbi:MAG: hypothetical protein LBM18_01395 [Oscillospiraceae bacterium]|jgi:hypothetical protein|nr:hypothetical protein [Oscillospiraceae bacterium]